ncbi:MAG TPA: hypothetical protein VML75_20165 [Kofleriaceae bacterium]|nr:hypothetical protein [Kofleriaceae bacterium]
MALYLRAIACVTGTVLVLGCGPRPGPGAGGPDGLARLAGGGDAPYELAEDGDLELTRQRFEALATDDPARSALRARLAAEYARRLDAVLDSGQQSERAFEHLLSLTSLWTAAELRDAAALASLRPFIPQARRIRTVFARGGGDEQATAAVALLELLEPDRAAAHAAEIDEIFAYTDGLSISEHGPGAQRSGPIRILERMADHLPAPLVVERLLTLYIDRQQAIERQFRRSGPDFGMIRAHGEGVLLTTRKIVRLLALAGRLDEAPDRIEGVVGLGDAPPMRRALVAALRPDARAKQWIALANSFRSDEAKSDDPMTAALVARLGVDRVADPAALHCYVGRTADAENRVHVAIAAFERCLALAPSSHEAADSLAGLYEARLGELIFGGRPRAAQAALEALEGFHAEAARRWPDLTLEHDRSKLYATLGRGMVSLGELDAAERYLIRSIELRHDFPALETLGTIALKRGRYDQAIEHLELALRLPGAGATAGFQRAKILRLKSDAHAGAGQAQLANASARQALDLWRDLAQTPGITPRVQTELFIEVGHLLWFLGQEEDALRAFEAAIAADPSGASTHAAVVAFLVGRDQPVHLLDAYHRALGNAAIGAYFKVYMSLWILAEARRVGAPADPLAVEFLARRNSDLWFDQLAAYASGTRALAPLAARANTRARRAELLYYQAVLGRATDDPAEVRKLLEQVVATDMISSVQYDMAKNWLEQARTSSPASAQRGR